MITLGIETSCDECACGIVNDKLEILSNKIFDQEDLHRQFGGVVPEVAARAHLEKIASVVKLSLEEANLELSQIDLIAYTRGPGLVGPLLVGASFAQGLGAAAHIPVAGISHLEGHLSAAILSQKDLKPPFLCLTVSGGHTELCLVSELFEYEVLGKTRDDAAGEAFDKCGKVLQLGYPAGPLISKHAEKGDRKFVTFPQGLNQKGNFEFSFSGLKTSFSHYIQNQKPEFIQEHLSDICASLESAIVEILVKKTVKAAQSKGVPWVAICGGVSANKHLRQRMVDECEKRDIQVAVPDFSLCTDNGAMIAGIAQMRASHKKLNYNTIVQPSLAWEN